MKKDALIKLISFAVALSLVAALVIFKSEVQKNEPDAEVTAIFSDFSLAISRANNLLELLLKAEDAQLPELAAELSEQLQRADRDYSLLNFENAQSDLDTFLSFSGDYVLKYAEDVKKGQASREQRSKIESLKAVTAKFSHELSKIEPVGSAEKITEEIRQGYNKANNEALSNQESSASSSFSDSSSSETADSGNPLENSEPIDENEALRTAEEFLNGENLKAVKAQKNGIEVFEFKSDAEQISISVNGGFVVSFSRVQGEEIKNFSDEQCILKAQEFMEKYHSANFASRYFESDEKNCFIVLTTKNGATLCNSDKAEITVSKQSGEIIGFNAAEFLKNYHNRTLQAPVYAAEQARNAIEEGYEIRQEWQVLTAAEKIETMCYEFLCKTQESGEQLIRVNAQNLKVEDKITLPKNKNYGFLK